MSPALDSQVRRKGIEPLNCTLSIAQRLLLEHLLRLVHHLEIRELLRSACCGSVHELMTIERIG